MTRSTTIWSPRIATVLLVAGTALAATATPAPAAAQDSARVDAIWEPAAAGNAIVGLGADDGIVTSGFGTQDVDIATISWMRFFPIRSSDGYGFGGSGTIARHATGADTRLFAEINSGEVPNGALITQIVFYVRDDHSVEDITGSWCVFDVESNVGSDYGGTCSPVGGTSGTPGQTFFFSDLANTVQRRFHDGTEFRIGSYGLLFWPHTATDELDIRMARILWRRQVSPAPASATFDDVPTSHLFFRSIEALADAGITGGCGGGNYCPNTPVTRGQMAAFLASALGLHWPAF